MPIGDIIPTRRPCPCHPVWPAQVKPCGHHPDLICGCGSLPSTHTVTTWPESDDGYVGRHRRPWNEV